MLKYLIRRLLWLLVVLLGISIITFLMTYLVPVDPARVFAGPKASAAVIASVRHQMGLDKPIFAQYCVTCHNDKKMSAGMTLETFTDTASTRKSPDLWAKVKEMLENKQGVSGPKGRCDSPEQFYPSCNAHPSHVDTVGSTRSTRS